MKISIAAIDAGFDSRSLHKMVILPEGVTEVEYDGPKGKLTATGDLKAIKGTLRSAGYLVAGTWNIVRDGEPPLKFTGAEIGSGSTHTNRGDGQNRWTEVTIWKTKGGKYVTKVSNITCWQGESDHHRATSFATPAELVEWLKDDNDGSLGRASQDACEEAAKNDAEFGKAFIEEVD